MRPPGVAPYTMLGRAGVLIFFVHTAYVLMGSLERTRALGIAGRALVWQFYVRRAFRIYPLAIATILLVRLLHLPVRLELWSRFQPASLYILFTNLALIQNLTQTPNLLIVLWSLPIEVQMYGLLPGLNSVLRRASLLLTAALWLGVVVLVRFLLQGHPPSDHRLDLLVFAPCFLAGIAAYHVSGRVKARLNPALWLPLLLSLLACFALIGWLRVPGSGLPRNVSAWALTAAVAMGLILVRDAAKSWMSAMAHVIAKYSYGIYLVHVPVLTIALRVWPAPRSPWWWAGVVAGIALCSWAAYQFIEAPGIRLGQRLIHGRGDLAAYTPPP